MWVLRVRGHVGAGTSAGKYRSTEGQNDNLRMRCVTKSKASNKSELLGIYMYCLPCYCKASM